MRLLDLWPAVVLILGTPALGVAGALIVDGALGIRDLRRGGLDRQPAATPPPTR